MSKPDVKRTRKSPEQRRRDLLGCAVAISIREGLASITLRRVATELGVTPGLVTHYFTTAEQLITATFTETAEADLTRVFAEVDDRGAESGVRALIDLMLDDSSLDAAAVWLDAWSLGRWNRLLAEEIRRLSAEWTRRMTAVIENDVANGHARTRDPKSAAAQLITILDGLAGQRVVRSASIEDIRHIARTYSHAELGVDWG